MPDAEPAPGSAEIAPPTTLAPGHGDADALADGPEHQQLSTRAVGYWRVSLLLRVVPLMLVVGLLAILLSFPPDAVRVVAVAAVWIGGPIAVVVVPPLRRRIWWFAIADEEVDLNHGLLTITRTVVPMVRVQHVDLHRGPLADRFGLAEIELHTAAGSLTIPALDREQAERIRRQVAVLARVPDDV